MIEINDDETASRILTEAKQATGDEREQMADALIAYGEKKAAEEYNQADEHFAKLYTDDSYFEETNANDTALLEAVNPETTARRASNHAYLEHRFGREIPAENYDLERDAFAMANYGQKNLSDAQFFDFVRGEYEWQKQRTEAINDLQMQAVAKAINDSQLGQNRPFVDGMTEVFNEWQSKYPELVDGQNDAAFLSQGYKLYNDTIRDLDTVRPQASKALSTLTAFTQGSATDEELQSLASDFVGAPPEDRQKIYKYVTLAAQAGQIDRAGLEQFAVNMGQAFTRGFDFVPQGTLQMQEAGVNNWLESIRNGTQIWVPVDGDLTKAVVGNAPAGAESDAWRQATLPETETLIQSGHNVRESFKVVRELRNVAKTGVDPIRPVLEEDTFWGPAERGAYALAGSIPLMGATAVNPYLGVLAYQATEYDRIMLENPDIDPQFAQGLALVEGAANAAIDRVQLKSLSGKLPMFGRYLDRIKSDGIRRTIKIGANVFEQNVQEGAQDLIAPVLETAVAALREDMPDKDFSSLTKEWWGQRAETFFATLPLSLIGGGIATYQDIKNPSAELNATKLRQVGFDKEQVTFIQRADNPEEYTARIQMEWGNRTPENIEAGRQEVIAEMQKAATPSENDARISETVAEDGTRRWVVTAPDGRELLQTQDQQAALEAVRQHSEAQMINERNTVADMVDYFRAQDPTNTATIEAPRTVQQELDRLTEAGDAKGIANLNERIRFAGIPEGADLTTYNILGEANVETTAEGVFRGVIKLRENSRPEDAFEEINHVFVRKAIAEGRVTLDALRGWVTQTAEATGETYAAETETDIIENIAKIGMDYAAGRIEETSLPASFVDYIKRMLQVFKEAMARALKLKDAFATGKIDANFETFLAESVGLNQQTLVDTARERVGNEVLTDTNYSIGSPAFQNWFADSKTTDAEGKPMVVYHGTQRPDRVGNRFRKTRATSGPMAFFTNDPAIASSYATGKKDTSIEMPSDYAGWFKWKGKGMRSPVNIDQAWWNLSEAERATIKERIYTVGYSDADEASGPIVSDSQSIMSRDSIDYELRQARGNAIRALVEMWLSSGSLFNQEEKFLEVLQAAGVKGATLDDPNAARSAVYPVYLSIKNPLDTASIPENVVAALEQASKGKRAKRAIGGNPDAWDKNTISGKDWMSALKEDIANGTTHAWTRIPDWATQTLSSLGYDGIKDTGGKRGGTAHQVWIPFNETQIKSATGNRGTFDPTSPNINYSIRANYSSEDKYNQIIPEISSVNPNKVSRRDMYEVAKVSPDVAANMSFEKPIEVSLFADGTLMLSDGHHRLAAAKQLGMNSIPAVVRSINAKGNHINALIAEQQLNVTNYSIGFAPNGKPSNLTTEEQALARSPEFKARVGDWEALAKQKVLELLPQHTPSIDIPKNLKGKELKNVVKPFYEKQKTTGFILPDGIKINITNRGWKEINIHGADSRVLHIAANLQELLSRSLHLWSENNTDNKYPNVKNFHNYGTRATLNGIDSYIRFVIREDTNGQIHYDHDATSVEVFSANKNGEEGSQPTRNPNPGEDLASLAKNRLYQWWNSVNPESVTVKTDENGEPLASEIARFRQETGTSNYSIASQSEIDRVNKALGGMNRGPDARIAVYERAKAKFSSVLQENKDIIDAIRTNVTTDTAPALQQVEMDRASRLADIDAEENSEVGKALQDNADTFMPRIEAAQSSAERKRVERDAKERAKILEQGIRDKYAERKKLTESQAKAQRDQIVQTAQARDSAANARMRDKVRLTKMTTALGSLDAILSVLPHEIQGKVGGFTVLTKIGTGDKALADFFIKRIEMIDRELERSLKKEYGNALDSLLERTKPKKAAAGEKPKGIGADIQSMFAVVREARDWSAEKVDGHIANIETQIASGNLTAQEEAMLTREADLVSLVGDWKNADSSRRAAALSAATETWEKGMSEFVQKKIREREERDMARAEAIKATGKKGKYTERRERDKKDNGIKGQAHGWYIDTLSWDQAVNVLFGHESPLAIRLSDGQRKAEYAKIDGIQAKEDALHDLFTKLAGGKRVDGERLMWDMSQPSIPANGLNLSELEALTATMMWAQEDGRRHMTGELDETGNPIGDWHYDQKFVDDIEAQLSPEAKMVREFLWNNYGTEWFAINEVFREMNGINLPRIPKYSPVSVTPINIPSGMVADPVTGNAVSATSISPGALRNRGVAIAEPVFRNAIQTYIAHTRQMEHWKAFAPWIKEANGILRFRKVHNAMHEASGGESSLVIGKFLDVFAQGGNRDASLTLEISKTMGGMASRAAQVALVGRVGTLAIQTTQIGAATAELPVGAYLSRLGKLVTGNLGWGDALNSKYIQRRLKQMPPTVQIAMEGLKAGKPNQLKHQVQRIGQLISGTDALWTAGTYAMVYDYQLGQAKAAGYRGQPAEEYAHNIAERITDRLAQPTRMGTRSIYELTATNPGARLAWAFASESRKNLALLAYTKANRPLKRFLAATAGYVFFNLAMGALIRNAWKDMRDDGDDEDDFFDEKTWNWKRMGVAMLTEPLQGMPLLGDYTEKGINAALGQYHQSSDLINFERGIKSFKNIPDILQGERDAEGVLKDIDGMVSLMGLFNQNAAAAASLTHIASDFFGVVDNATTDE